MSLKRCAIYTRKSSEEGLDQDFNSLEAQREACAAYVLSQRHEGWRELPGRYDDGGISGGTMNRPGLQRLLDDVRAGRIRLDADGLREQEVRVPLARLGPVVERVSAWRKTGQDDGGRPKAGQSQRSTY